MPQEQLRTYSFLDVVASINGPGGNFSLAADAASAEEGITIAPNGDIGTMTIGADGAVMHNLHGDKSGKATFRYLKTSPANQKLMAMYDLQTSSSALYGQNVITIGNPVVGDAINCLAAAFSKAPEIAYSKDGPMLEWEFNVGIIGRVLGS